MLRSLTVALPDDSLECMTVPSVENARPRPPINGVILEWLRGRWPVALLLSGFLLAGLGAAEQKSPTFDEPFHVTGGYSYWAYNDYRVHPENGNWSQR